MKTEGKMIAAGALGVAAMVAAGVVHIDNPSLRLAFKLSTSAVVILSAAYLLVHSRRYAGDLRANQLQGGQAGSWIGPWKAIYFVSVVPIFFGLWILYDIYLSKSSRVFPDSWGQFGISILSFGVLLNLISASFYRKR